MLALSYEHINFTTLYKKEFLLSNSILPMAACT